MSNDRSSDKRYRNTNLGLNELYSNKSVHNSCMGSLCHDECMQNDGSCTVIQDTRTEHEAKI